MRHGGYWRLKRFLRMKGITYQDIAKTLGVSYVCICNKMNGRSDFRISEAQRIQEKWDIPTQFFYAESCDNNNK